MVPDTKYTLEANDHVTVMKVMLLRSQETMSGRKEYIVAGATLVCGEDTPSIGKILIFDVLDVIPEPGKPLTKNKLKCLYNQEQKGIVSALEAVDGLILSCMGQKIFMWNFKDNKDLVGVAFIDTDIYSLRAVSLKNFIVVCDIHHSIQLLKYKENRRTLSLVSQDPYPVDVYTSEYMIDGNQIGIVVSDSDKNLIIYQYQPEVPESNGGRYLIRQGDINIGCHVNAMFRMRCRPSAPLGASHEMQVLMQDKRHTTYFATLDGSLGYLLPLPETTFRRLKMLQIKLVQGLPHNAGLNPKAFRTFHTHHQYLYSAQHKVLDGELLWRYIQLSGKEKADFAKQIGTSVAQILEDLKEVDKVSAHF
jgi:cleavage and polyadenylation specificity factor subunit 1